MARLSVTFCCFLVSLQRAVVAQAALPDAILDRILLGQPKARVVIALRLDPGIESRPDAISQAASLALQGLNGKQIRVHFRFDHVAALIATIDSEALMVLRANPSVAGVEWDRGGYGLEIPPEPVNKLDRVAVLDTGIPDGAELGAPDKLESESCFCRLEAGAGCCPDGSHRQEGPGSAHDELAFPTTSLDWLRATMPPDANVPSLAPAIRVVKILSRQDQFDSWDSVFTALDHLLDRSRLHLNRVLFSFASARLYATPDCGSSATAAVLRDAMAEFIRQGIVPTIARASGGPGPGSALPGCLQIGTPTAGTVVERLPQPSQGGGMNMPGNPGGPPPSPVPENGSAVFGVIESVMQLSDADAPPVDTPANTKWQQVRVRVLESTPLQTGGSSLVSAGQTLNFDTTDSPVGLGPGQAVKFSASLTGSNIQQLYYATGFRLVDGAGAAAANKRR